MKLYLALSCLQGQDIKKAIDELMSLQPYGLQLTSGNKLKKDFDIKEYLKENKIDALYFTRNMLFLNFVIFFYLSIFFLSFPSYF